MSAGLVPGTSNQMDTAPITPVLVPNQKTSQTPVTPAMSETTPEKSAAQRYDERKDLNADWFHDANILEQIAGRPKTQEETDELIAHLKSTSEDLKTINKLQACCHKARQGATKRNLRKQSVKSKRRPPLHRFIAETQYLVK